MQTSSGAVLFLALRKLQCRGVKRSAAAYDIIKARATCRSAPQGYRPLPAYTGSDSKRLQRIPCHSLGSSWRPL